MTKKTLKDLELDHNKLKEAFNNLQKKFDDLSGKYETLHVSYEKLVEKSESFRCDKCEKTFSTKLDLNKHMLHKHKPTPGKFTCEHCIKTFSEESKLQAHMKSHLQYP